MKTIRSIRKKEAYLAFISTLKNGTVGHWQNVARAIGVDNDTITAWKKQPEAREALKKGIQRALDGMEKAGSKDWRMWESKLKMLGISPVDKDELNITSNGSRVVGFNFIIPKGMNIPDGIDDKSLVTYQ